MAFFNMTSDGCSSKMACHESSTRFHAYPSLTKLLEALARRCSEDLYQIALEKILCYKVDDIKSLLFAKSQTFAKPGTDGIFQKTRVFNTWYGRLLPTRNSRFRVHVCGLTSPQLISPWYFGIFRFWVNSNRQAPWQWCSGAQVVVAGGLPIYQV